MFTYVLYTVNGLLMLILPLAVATVIARRYRVAWGLFGIGAATFFASQIFHVPFVRLAQPRLLSALGQESPVRLLADAVFLGLAAGLFEETARYLAYRYWARDARSWKEGLMLGAGHGGMEAMLLSLLFFANMAILAGLRAGRFSALVPDSLLAPAQMQAEVVFSVPWSQTLLGAVERASALSLHLTLSVMVLLCFTRGRSKWFLLAVGWHAFVDGIAVVSISLWGPFMTEGVLVLMSTLGLLFIFAVGRDRAIKQDEPVTPEYEPPDLTEIAVSAEKLEQSRYD